MENVIGSGATIVKRTKEVKTEITPRGEVTFSRDVYMQRDGTVRYSAWYFVSAKLFPTRPVFRE